MKTLISKLIIIGFTFLVPILFSEELEKSPVHQPVLHSGGVGFSGGIFSGRGFSYRKWFGTGLHGIQLTGLPKGEVINGVGQSNLSLGLMYLYSIYEKSFTNFNHIGGSRMKLLSFIGSHGNYTFENNALSDLERDYSGGTSSSRVEHGWDEIQSYYGSLGAGVGGEFTVWRVTLSLLLGYGVQGIQEDRVGPGSRVPSDDRGSSSYKYGSTGSAEFSTFFAF